MSDAIVRGPDEADVEERWLRETDEPDLRGVEALRYDEDDGWQVVVPVAEFLREDPLERELREAMAAALQAVPGTTVVEEEDREIWHVDGEPSGEALVRAAAVVVDGLAARAKAHVYGQES